MAAPPLEALSTFVVVARLNGFSAAAARMGVSASAVSQTIRALEDKLGVALFQRSTRRVNLTDSGKALLARIEPALGAITAALDAVSGSQGGASAPLRINAPRLAAIVLLAPVLGAFRAMCPAVTLEVWVDDGLADIIGDSFDAGIRFGETLHQDMIAVPISAAMEMAVVGSPEYLAIRGTPESPHDLREHECLQWRPPGSGALYRWDFERGGRALAAAVPGLFVSNDTELGSPVKSSD
jgi:DNA-binding transcriptional LysR family regulator